MTRAREPLRAAARAAGERFYCDALPCPMCGDLDRYTVNGACVSCARAKGSDRYATMSEAEREVHKERDAERYQLRKQRGARRSRRKKAVADYTDLP